MTDQIHAPTEAQDTPGGAVAVCPKCHHQTPVAATAQQFQCGRCRSCWRFRTCDACGNVQPVGTYLPRGSAWDCSRCGAQTRIGLVSTDTTVARDGLRPYDPSLPERDPSQARRSAKPDGSAAGQLFNAWKETDREARQALRDNHELRRYGNGKRTFYGGLWSLYTILLVIGGFAALVTGSPVGLLGLFLGVLCGYYAYRIWTWQARHLWFLIIF